MRQPQLKYKTQTLPSKKQLIDTVMSKELESDISRVIDKSRSNVQLEGLTRVE